MNEAGEFVVPVRFRQVVTMHLLMQVTNVPTLAVPLILGIHGPPGTGKTFQCELILRELGARTYLISGGELESSEAGEPAALLRRTYLRASDEIKNGLGTHAAIVINDFDTGGGRWGDLVQYTVNSQTLFGELMHLCDYPRSVDRKDTERIPIIITGNDFSKLYRPLVRTGRMSLFSWEPTTDELTDILQPLFPDLSRLERQRLALEFPDKSISFFAHLKGLALQELLLPLLDSEEPRDLLVRLKRDPNLVTLTYDLSCLLALGKKLDCSERLPNHIPCEVKV